MLREIEHGLVGVQRQDNRFDAQVIVRARQVEALSLAWLLAANRNQAYDLAEAAFVALFHDLRKLEPEADPRGRLLVHLARAFMQDRVPLAASHQSEPARDATPEKYGIERLRDRTLAALGRLDRPERAALLLSDMCGIDPRQLDDDDVPAASLETARHRMRQSLDISGADSLRPLLVEAGFESPRDDLWPQLERPYAEIERRETRRRRLLTLGVVGVVVLMSTVSIAAIFGPGLMDDDDTSAAAVPTPTIVDDDLVIASAPPALPTPTPTPPALPVGDVPSTLLAMTYHDQRSNNPYSMFSGYDSESNELEPVLDDDEHLARIDSDVVLISPDCKQIVVVKEEVTATTRRYTAMAFDSSNRERQWETEIGLFERGVEQFGPSIHMSALITSDRVFIAVVSPTMPEGGKILAFDRLDGSLRESGTIALDPGSYGVDFEGSIYEGSVFLFARGESELLLGIETYARGGSTSSSVILYHVDLPALTLNDDPITIPGQTEQPLGLWGMDMTQTGDALYGLTYEQGSNDAQMSFLDLETGEFSELELPFESHANRPYEPQGATTSSMLSHDGRTLYVLEPNEGQVAIIDIAERRVERSFPLDTGHYDALFGSEIDQFSIGWSRAMSPDGTHLYLSAQMGGPTMRSTPPEKSGVWVIDLSEWRIVDFWPVDGQVGGIHTLPNEDAVLVSGWIYTAGQSGQALTRIDLSGQSPVQTALDLPTSDDGGSPVVVSLVELYRAQYGRSPSIDGVEQPGPAGLQTLPRIEASTTSDNVAAGVRTHVEVRILDPATGDVLRSPDPAVRFDPDSSVTAILTDEDGSRQIIVLAKIEAGVYRGSVTFETPAFWAIDVTVTGSNDATSVSPGVGWVNVAPTFIGSDGRLYQFSVSSDPEQPEVDEETTIQLRLIDIESGVPLPDDITLAAEQPALEGSYIEGMPERIDVAFTIDGVNEYGGFRTALLYQVSPGLYEGTVELWKPGAWYAEIRFQPPGGRRNTIPAGTIEVVER